MSYFLANEELDELEELAGVDIMHSCDNRLCVNPAHLAIGTRSENMKDAYNKGRIIVPHGKRFEVGHIPTNKKK